MIQFDDVEDDDFFLDDEEEGDYANVTHKSSLSKNNNNNNNDSSKITNKLFKDNGSDASNSNDSNSLIDNETKTEAFRHIIAGACMSMGLKFAGSFNNQAYETLVFLFFYKCLEFFFKF